MISADYPSAQLYIAREREKKRLKTIGRTAGFCIIAYVAIQNIMPVFLFIPSLGEAYRSNGAFTYLYTIFASVLSILVPFAIGGSYLRKKTGADTAPLEVPYGGISALFVAAAGMIVCLIGNYISGWIVSLAGYAGIDFSSPDLPVPSDAAGRLMFVLAVAVVPPLCEEIAVRGTIMQPLRRYGDVYAIVISSVFFGILHGNLVQAPFAFIAGLAFGYAVCATGSLWTGILIHFLNNMYSCILAFAMEDLGEKAYTKIYVASIFLVCFIGGICAVIYIFKSKKLPMRKYSGMLTSGEKSTAFFVNIPMLIAIAFMIFITAQFISRS